MASEYLLSAGLHALFESVLGERIDAAGWIAPCLRWTLLLCYIATCGRALSNQLSAAILAFACTTVGASFLFAEENHVGSDKQSPLIEAGTALPTVLLLFSLA